MDLSIEDKVFYTQSTGIRVQAKVLGHPDDGHVEFQYYQDGVRVVNHHCHIDFISLSVFSVWTPACHPHEEVPRPPQKRPRRPPREPNVVEVVMPGVATIAVYGFFHFA